MFVFDRCRRSSAVVTSVKYECDSRNITGSFARSKIALTEKLTSGALVPPTPGLWLSGHISRMDGPIDMEQNVYELVQYWIHYTV